MKPHRNRRSLPLLHLTLATAALALAAALGQTAFAGEGPTGSPGRTPLTQPECTICIAGTASAQWNGSSGSFHVDRVENRRLGGVSWPLALQVQLESGFPDADGNWQVGEYELSDRVELNPLRAGDSRSDINSGAIGFHGSNVPAGEYWMVMVVLENFGGGWGWSRGHDYVVMSDKVSCDGTSCVVMPPRSNLTRLLPVVIDVSSGSAHYTTDMALTNNTLNTVWLSMLYTASLGSKRGSGTVTDALAPGEQRQISDVLSYLREKGLAIPPSAEQPSQGGTLLVTFQGHDTIDPRLVSVTARTAALTCAPHPVGRAGLAYSGIPDTDSSASSLTLFGLRSTSTDRTNVAVFSTSGDPVTLKITVHSGSGDGRSVVFREAETLPPYGWLQYGSAQILDGNGITKGWVTVERISTTGSFSAYAVINDSKTNDGSYVQPVRGAVAGTTLTVPVGTEAGDLRSELMLLNKSASTVKLTLNWLADWGWFYFGQSTTIQLGPHEEKTIPDAIDFLWRNGFPAGPTDYGPYIGAVQIIVSGTAAENVFAGTRTATPSPAGGQFGLFTPCIYSGQEASSEAYIYGLRADSENRSNVVVANTGTDSDGPVLLQLQAYDGDSGGTPKGEPLTLSVLPTDLLKSDSFFRSSGVKNGWVKITRMSGTAPWIAYGVVNDGCNPGERTGDGAYVPMVK